MAQREYLDCEYYLAGHNQSVLRVEGREYAGQLDIDIDSLRHSLAAPAVGTSLSKQGALLFRALFPKNSRLLDGYRDSLSRARQEEKHVRFRLHVAPEAPIDLHRLNWELLFDDVEKRCLSRWRETAFSRYASVPLNAPAPAAGRPKLLVVIGAPSNWEELKLARIDPEQARQEMAAALDSVAGFMPYEIMQGPATPARVRNRLDEGGFQAVHVYAHGLLRENPETGLRSASLVLEEEDGTGAPVGEDLFAEIFDGLSELRLVTLMTCHGGVQTQDDPFGGLGPTLVRLGVPAVISMRRSISFVAARIFTESFYDYLARHGRVDAAANEARQHAFLTLNGVRRHPAAASIEWSSPTLTMRLRDARVWDAQQASALRLPEGATGVDWDSIIQAVQADRVLPIIGPGLNHGMLLSNESVTERWSAEYNYSTYNYPSNNRNDLPRVAQFVETMRSRKFPHGRLLTFLKEDLMMRLDVQTRDRLREATLTQVIQEWASPTFDGDKDSPYRVLAELPFSNFITCNFDGYLSAALKWARRRQVVRERCRWRRVDKDSKQYQVLKGTRDEPLVFHLYGDDSDSTTLVLTEDDHLNWLRAVSKDDWRVPRLLRGKLNENMLLFLGFNMRDLDFRVLFKGLIDDLKEMVLPRVVVLQIHPDEGDERQTAELLNFLSRDCQNLDFQIYPGHARGFLSDLRQQLGRV